MTKKYIGITIGPIIETMSYTSTPAGLWMASYFFSSITKGLSDNLTSNKYIVITVPNDFKSDVEGIGKYHDRIYAITPDGKNDEEIAKEVDSIIESVIIEKAQLVAKAIEKNSNNYNNVKKTLKDYLQIHYIVMNISDEEVLASTIAKSLDALENSGSTAGIHSHNSLVQLVSGNKSSSNEYLKKYEGFDKSGLLIGENVVDLEYIARNETAWKQGGITASEKIRKYFAIIQADGDGMGRIVNADLTKGISLEEQEERIKIFSKLCMKYTGEATKLIREYNGVVIYAGGDDLLFLAPIVSKNNNIWLLCKQIGEKFDEIFNPEKNEEAKKIVEVGKIPSVSFGVSVNYYKFPLYEAFEDARGLLFGIAKKFGSKNNYAISVNKASGQRAGYVCRMESNGKSEDSMYGKILEYTNMLVNIDNHEESNIPLNKSDMLHSLLYHIENNRELLKIAIKDDNKRKKFFENVFDSIKQNEFKQYIDSIYSIAEKIHLVTQNKQSKEEIIESLISTNSDDKEIDILISILRTSKLLVEEKE